MTTQALTKDTNTNDTSKLQVEDTNTQTHADIELPFPHEEPLSSVHAVSWDTSSIGKS
jgi:hypothetical protein